MPPGPWWSLSAAQPSTTAAPILAATTAAHNSDRRKAVPALVAAPPPPLPPGTTIYFVFSSAGKLLYTSCEDDADGHAWALTQASVMHAMLSLFEENEQLQRISLPNVHIAFLERKPLYTAYVSTHGDPDNVVHARLERVYFAILSLISRARLHRLFARAPNLDLQALIGPMKAYVDAVVYDMHASAAFAFDSAPIRTLDMPLRDSVARTCVQIPPEKRPLHLLYILLYDHGQLVSVSHPKRHVPHPSDFALLSAMVRVSCSEDTWAPLCLPALAPDAFAHVYAGSMGRAQLVLVCGDKDGYVACRAWRDAFVESACMSQLDAALATPPPTTDAMGLPALRDVVFSSRRLQQCTMSPDIPAHRRILFEHVLCALRGKEKVDVPLLRQRQPPVPSPLQLVVVRTDQEAVLGWRTPTFELCISTSPLLASSAIGDLANKVVAWIRQQDKRLFAKASTF